MTKPVQTLTNLELAAQREHYAKELKVVPFSRKAMMRQSLKKVEAEIALREAAKADVIGGLVVAA